jgi:hypothetical protein
VDDMEKLLHFSQSPVPFLSAHVQISFSCRFKFPYLPLSTFSFQDEKSFDVDKFHEELSSCDWNEVFCSICIDAKLKCFNSNVLNSINLVVPL